MSLKFAYRSALPLPQKQWLTPLPFEVRDVGEDGQQRGRWRRVYQDLDGRPIALVTLPKRNSKVHLPAEDYALLGVEATAGMASV